MNAYNNIRFTDFRKKYAYEKAIKLIEQIDKLIGKIESFEKGKVLKQTIKIATEIGLAESCILSKNNKDYHFCLALKYTIQLNNIITEKVARAEYKSSEVEEILSNIKEIIILTRSYRKTLRKTDYIDTEGEKESMKTVNASDGKLNIRKIEEQLESLKEFRSLKGYQIAIKFFTQLFAILSELPYYEQYGVFDQMQRSSTSIIANLAEGNNSIYPKIKVNFYSIAFCTTSETQAWLDVLKIKKHITESQCQELNEMLEEIKKLIVAYIRKELNEQEV